MSASLFSPKAQFDTLPSDFHRAAATDPRSHVQSMIHLLLRRSVVVERRRDQRYPYPHLVTLIPVAPDGSPLMDQAIVVVGKQLSVGGLSFYHRAPLPQRRAIVVLEAGGERAALLVDLSWCRFTRPGWYENGGRFLQAVSPDTPWVLSGDRPLL